MTTPAEHLASILETGVVRVGFEAESFERAVHDLLAPALAAQGIQDARVGAMIDAVLTRERAGSTCAGALALPHARVSGVANIVCGMGVNHAGIYPEDDVQFMIAFVSPQESAALHLRFLSDAARTFRNTGLLDALRAARTAGEAIGIVRSAQR